MRKKKILEEIKKKIWEFDLCTLVKTLENAGYHWKDIYFESNLNQTSPKSLCEGIDFSDEAPRVRVSLNFGLLSIQSPLPSFFRKYIETEEINGDQFIRFLSFFNHRLIEEFLNMTMPERNKFLFFNWRETHFDYLSLLGFESISTLSLLFKSCFPELVIEIEKNARMMRFHDTSLLLGRDGLGPNSHIGERVEQTFSSFRVILVTDEELSELRIPWPIEINRRLIDWLFPILKKTDIHLSIILIIKHKFDSMQLAHGHFLGFDRIGPSNHPFELLLFRGFMKDLRRNVFLSG